MLIDAGGFWLVHRWPAGRFEEREQNVVMGFFAAIATVNSLDLPFK
jgi:hypothetical protein